MQAIQPQDVAIPGKPYSPVVVSGGFAFCSGAIPIDADGEIVSGTFVDHVHAVFDNVIRCLAAAGSDLSHVVKVSAYLTNVDDFEAFNEIYRSRFDPPYPARTTVCATLLDERFLFEMDVVAEIVGVGDV